MKNLLTLILLTLTCSLSYAEDGSRLWMGTPVLSNPCTVVIKAPTSPTVDIARQELESHWSLGSRVNLVLNKKLRLGEGYRIIAKRNGTSYEAAVHASRPIGLLYGAYDLLRMQNSGTLALHGSRANTEVDKVERPAFPTRMLNHWDNLDGSIERGYAGKSIWKWEQISNGTMTETLRSRIRQYAAANASLGINASVLNNVNASPKMLTREYLDKVKLIADILRPYGITTYLSINFATPMALGDTKTADPLDKDVAKWWKKKAKEVYSLIPDFGGFLVKANSEGQPGPGDYQRTHAEGANMLADAVKSYGGKIIWRSFVYGANHKNEDRVKQSLSEFKPMDGKFRPNVILQSKNGPLDFQPREPFAPIFMHLKKTPQYGELQITQEYLGQSKHLVYLAPMWKEFFSFVHPSLMQGIAAVANIGDDANWCGHPFSLANWYAFGRLAWNPELSSEEIADEWLRQTFSMPDEAIATLKGVMMESREACVNYMMPLGLHHIFKFDHHYGPEPDGFKADYPLEWCPVYYHRADSIGVGFDRTVATGSGATAQYPEPYASEYDNIATCPEEYLLWFHHVPWTYRMKSGKTLWQELCDKYNAGVATVRNHRYIWHYKMKPYVDAERWQHVDTLLNHQLDNAREWRNVCLDYFQTFSKLPVN
ncbi:alpha-glucuronidase [Hallella bergensis]|uniref:alpha-glucuronidase n=1 Tax=Hallella bergensis TaxID=242750 RepID=UPI0023EF89E3|nr:alpha-glucuronidase [Hallella bergensis]